VNYVGVERPLPKRNMNRRQQGILKVSMEAMECLLDLPLDSHIKHARVDPEKFGVIDIVVESPNLCEVAEGAMIPIVSLKEIRGWDE
jgi:hypothetical protein